MVEQICLDVAETVIDDAFRQVEDQLEIESHPYTQDPNLFGSIMKLRLKSIKRNLDNLFSNYSTYEVEKNYVNTKNGTVKVSIQLKS